MRKWKSIAADLLPVLAWLAGWAAGLIYLKHTL